MSADFELSEPLHFALSDDCLHNASSEDDEEPPAVSPEGDDLVGTFFTDYFYVSEFFRSLLLFRP